MIRRQFSTFRGIAIIFLILNHSAHMILWYSNKFTDKPLSNLESTILGLLQKPGIFVVPTFLFISGCFYAYAIQGRNQTSSWKFVIESIKHILGPYLFWSIVFYFILNIFYKDSYPLWTYVKFLFVGYPHDFIPLLIFFYLLSPLLVPISRRFGWFLIVVILIYQLTLLNILFPGIIGTHFPDWMRILKPPIITQTFSYYGVYFPLGIVYSLYQKEADIFFSKYKFAILIIAACLFVISAMKVLYVNIPSISDILSPVFLLLLIPTLRLNNIINNKYLYRIGNRSLGLYLMNLTTINLFLFGVHTLVPWLFSYVLVLVPILFFFTMFFQMEIIDLLAHVFKPSYSRYMFGHI